MEESSQCRHATDLGMAFLNYLLAVKATQKSGVRKGLLGRIGPDNRRVGGNAAKKRVPDEAGANP